MKVKASLYIWKASGIFFFFAWCSYSHYYERLGWLIIQAIESTATVFIFSKGFSLSSTTDWDHNKVYITHDALIHKTQEHLWKTTTNSDISARVETRDTRGLLQTRELLASGAPWLTLEKPHNRWIVPGSLKSRKMQHLSPNQFNNTGHWGMSFGSVPQGMQYSLSSVWSSLSGALYLDICCFDSDLYAALFCSLSICT